MALAARYPAWLADPVRIALVSDVYLPRLGGIEVQVADLAHHLRGVGNEVQVITATPGEPLAGVTRLLPPIRLPAPINPWAGPALRAELSVADVVHVHLGVVAPFASHAARIALASGRPTVITWHSMFGALPLPYAVRWRGWVAAGAVPTAVSAIAARKVQAMTGPEVPVMVLPNGIELADWERPGARDAPALADDDPVRMVSAIRFARRKRPLQLIALARAIRALVPPQRRLELVVAGAGPLLSPARNKVRALGADWIELPGRLARTDLARLYHRSHLYLSPAQLESFGIAALEGRTAGLAVAGMEGSGITEFVRDGVEGVLAPDDGGLATAAADLINHPDRLTQMITHNVSTPPDQEWGRVVETTLTAYARAMGSRPGRVA